MSLPLYRIETDLKACGATISRQDMANWMMNVLYFVKSVFRV